MNRFHCIYHKFNFLFYLIFGKERKMIRLSKVKRRKWLAIIVIGFIVILAFSVTFMFSMKQLENKYAVKYEQLEAKNAANQKIVYVAQDMIHAGTQITNDNIVMKELFLDMENAYFIDSSDIGKVAVLDIEKDMPVMKVMLTSEIEEGMREEEFSCIQWMSN